MTDNMHSPRFHHNDCDKESFDPLERVAFVSTELNKLQADSLKPKDCADYQKGKGCVFEVAGDAYCEDKPCHVQNGKRVKTL